MGKESGIFADLVEKSVVFLQTWGKCVWRFFADLGEKDVVFMQTWWGGGGGGGGGVWYFCRLGWVGGGGGVLYFCGLMEERVRYFFRLRGKECDISSYFCLQVLSFSVKRCNNYFFVCLFNFIYILLELVGHCIKPKTRNESQS